MKTLNITFLFILFVFQYSFAQTKQPVTLKGKAEKVDSIMADYDRNDAPGCAVGVVQDGKLIFAKGYGMADLEHDAPITPETNFYLASVSKQFTAFAVALLADEGKLSLDDDIRKWIPELPDYGQTITIKNLLHHTSGLRDFLALLSIAGRPNDGRLTTNETLNIISRQQELNFQPGTEYLYSNTGYFLLGVLVERVSGQSLKEFAEKHIFGPLGMKRTTYRDNHNMLIEDRAMAYEKDSTSGFGYQLNMPGFDVVGSGGVYSNIEDLARWADNLESHKVGGEKVANMMLTRGILKNGDTLDYALGLGIGDYRGLRTVGHGGAYEGYRTYLRRFPDYNFTVITLCNRRDGNAGKRALQVADIYLENYMEPKEHGKSIANRETVHVAPELLENYAGTYRAPENFPIPAIIYETSHGQLFETSLPGEHIPLVALSDTLFQYEDGSARRVSFKRRSDGTVEQLILISEDDQPMLKRIESSHPTMDKLQDYTGKYYSSELESFIKLDINNGILMTKDRRGGDLQLKPIEQDVFAGEYPLLKIHFKRDINGKITGFKVSAGRTRNLWFEKQK
ncbi:hypothetical protein C7S20_03595 [Christiangramia fulva]|uniref:Beta-lactamase-related domain-containing protein n=1 Tax=Christiangramia fulva TaxID=2126553 RepID=A0A2R3Z2C4_9FLAO|nr:serine hydrolase domain-containing protein [Christiangramia fulva]AVR44414.1 hypothetical protein C7S20_03595 [Christiangramia fulva]